MRQKSFRSGQLNSWLVVSLSLLLIVGEPAILQAGPCEDDCENKKAKALAACGIAFRGNETKCLIDATTDNKLCGIKLELAIENAERLATNLTMATGVAYYIGFVGCIAFLNPPCYMANFAANSGAVVLTQINLKNNLEAARREVEACDKGTLAKLNACRRKRDTDRNVAVKIANDDCARCKNNCGGNNGGGDNGGG